MKILQTIKYAYPSKGGMESVAKDIVEGVSLLDKSIDFTVYSSAEKRAFKPQYFGHNGISYVKESTFGYFKSQPLTLFYKELGVLIDSHDIIHHHYPFPNMELNLVNHLSKLKNKKFILTWHANIGQSRWKALEKFYNPLVFKLLDRADRIVVTSPQLLEYSNILPAYANKIEVIPLSYNERYEQVTIPKLIKQVRPLRALFVGRLREYKGLSILLHAIRDLDITLNIVGQGEYGTYLHKLVNELQIGHKVQFYANLSDREVEEMYEKSDVFVLPSINEAEAFGVVQLEAMAKGLPVINTKLQSGVPFVSIDGLTGLTVAPKSSLALQEAIVTLMNDPNLYNRFSINALERVQSFTRKKLAQSYLSLYHK